MLVKVNGEIFTKDRTRTAAGAGAASAGQPIDLKADPSNQQLRKVLDEDHAADRGRRRQRNADGRSAVAKLGYTMSNEQFNGIVENIKKENKIETEEQFPIARCKTEGMSMSDLRAAARTRR